MLSILVTGATGSFGNAFIRRLLRGTDYDRICIFSRDELKQQQMRAALDYECNIFDAEARTRWFIGDVRDEKRLKQALSGIDYVVHAAALKQVPSCEYNPREAVLTNIFGALNVIDAAIACGVKKVIALSSDKAVAPVNLYGKTKAAAESLFCQANVYSPSTRFSCVRYGNIFGSRGSVIPLWEKQLATSGKVQITAIDMTRFMMVIEESCHLVERALSDMVGGEIFVPMVRSVRIGDLKQAWDADAPFDIIGIRPGEKMHEQLISEHEGYRTLRQGARFVILPAAREWVSEKIEGIPLSPGVSYSSDNNPELLNVEEIREWLNSIP